MNKSRAGIVMRIALALLVGGAILGGIQPVSAANIKLRWLAGWDEYEEPLKFATSFVRFNHTAGTNSLVVTYDLEKAQPNTVYGVGLHLFPVPPECPQSFGNLTPFTCGEATREGETHLVAGFQLGAIRTNEAGNGNLSVAITGIAPETYALEFDVWVEDGVFCPFCPRVFQSPGPFGNTVAVEID